jgi:hypothetical protein
MTVFVLPSLMYHNIGPSLTACVDAHYLTFVDARKPMLAASRRTSLTWKTSSLSPSVSLLHAPKYTCHWTYTFVEDSAALDLGSDIIHLYTSCIVCL